MTNSTRGITIQVYAIVEVANVISTAADQAIAGAGKGLSPKESVLAMGRFPGTVQNMYRTVIGFGDALLWGGNVFSRPVSATWGDFL